VLLICVICTICHYYFSTADWWYARCQSCSLSTRPTTRLSWSCHKQAFDWRGMLRTNEIIVCGCHYDLVSIADVPSRGIPLMEYLCDHNSPQVCFYHATANAYARSSCRNLCIFLSNLCTVTKWNNLLPKFLHCIKDPFI